MRTLLQHLGIKSDLTTAYHPQSNGQTEHANQEIEKYLHLYVSRRQEDWAEPPPWLNSPSIPEFTLHTIAHHLK